MGNKNETKQFEEMRKDTKERLEKMENKLIETLIFLDSKVALKIFQISIFFVIELKLFSINDTIRH